jgi:hypothetical protein
MKSEEFSILSNQNNLNRLSKKEDSKRQRNIYENYYSNAHMNNQKWEHNPEMTNHNQKGNSIHKSKFFYNTRNSENNQGNNSRLEKFKAERQRRNKIFHTRSVSQNVSSGNFRSGSNDKQFNGKSAQSKSKTFDKEKLKGFLKNFNSQPKTKIDKEADSNIAEAIDRSMKMMEGNYKQNIEFLQVNPVKH